MLILVRRLITAVGLLFWLHIRSTALGWGGMSLEVGSWHLFQWQGTPFWCAVGWIGGTDCRWNEPMRHMWSEQGGVLLTTTGMDVTGIPSARLWNKNTIQGKHWDPSSSAHCPLHDAVFIMPATMEIFKFVFQGVGNKGFIWAGTVK